MITVPTSMFLDVTYGMIMAGFMMTSALFGVVSAQTGWYYRHYTRDRNFLKCMVASLWLLDVLNLVFYIGSMWILVVQKTTNSANLPWPSFAQIVSNALAIASIQGFYVYRIWTLSKNVLLLGVLAFFVVADFGMGLLLFAKSVQTMAIGEFSTLTPYDIALSSTTAVTDVLLSATLVTLLSNSRTGSPGANRLINRLLFYTINTGFMTSICSILSLISVLLLPTTAAYVMFYYVGSRLYTVSLLAMLNAREGLRAQAEKFGHASLPNLRMSNSVSRRSVRAVVEAMQPAREIVVEIQRDTTVTFEEHEDRSDPHSKEKSKGKNRRSYFHPTSSTLLSALTSPGKGGGSSKMSGSSHSGSGSESRGYEQ